MIPGIVIMLSFYTAANFYIAGKISLWFGIMLPESSRIIITVIYLFLAFSLFFRFIPFPKNIRRIAVWISSYWMSIFIHMLMLFVTADLLVLLGILFKLILFPIPQIVRFYSGLAVLALLALIIAYGIANTKKIKNASYTIQTKKVLAENLSIALVSDLHLGAANSEKLILRTLKNINNLKPDIVCIAGDIFHDSPDALGNPSRVIDLFNSIASKYGVFACLGNHDGGKSYDAKMKFLEQCNVRVLKDEHVIIDSRLALIGRVDSSPIGGFGGIKRKDISGLMASIDKELPIIVLDHNPANIKQYDENFDLILCGHTHRGQIIPFKWITGIMYTANYGHYRKDSNSPHVIVTSGAGTATMPIRTGTNNETAQITFFS